MITPTTFIDTTIIDHRGRRNSCRTCPASYAALMRAYFVAARDAGKVREFWDANLEELTRLADSHEGIRKALGAAQAEGVS